MRSGGALMDWKAVADFAQVTLIVGQAVVLGILFLLKGTFATKKDLGGAIELGANAHHRLDLLEQRVNQLPTHDTIVDLRKDIGALKTGQAENNVKLDGVDEKIDLVRGSINRLDEYLRMKT